MNDQPNPLDAIKSGDQVAYQVYREWRLATVNRRTNTGWIVCDHHTFTADGRVRGRHSYGGPYRCVVPTSKIREEVNRRDMVSRLNSFNWNKLDTSSLHHVCQILDEEVSDDD